MGIHTHRYAYTTPGKCVCVCCAGMGGGNDNAIGFARIVLCFECCATTAFVAACLKPEVGV